MNKPRKSSIGDLALIALFVALLALCSYISIPLGGANITLQLFGVYLCIFCLGAKKGLGSIAVYVIGGTIGLPLFSGFTGGLSVILGPFGGYIIGFIPSALIFTFLLHILGKTKAKLFISALISLPFCYLIGTLWYCGVYLGDLTPQRFTSVLPICVLPYVIPDVLKLIGASILGNKINKILSNSKKGVYNVRK